MANMINGYCSTHRYTDSVDNYMFKVNKRTKFVSLT